MGIVIDDQYREQLSERFSEILRIDSVFHGMKSRAEMDFQKGIIDNSMYREIMDATYFAPLSSRCASYAIPEKDRLLVLKYGKFTKSGELSLNDLDAVYLDIIGRMDNVGNSVKNYYSFYNLSLEELREKVLEFVKDFTNQRKEELLSKIRLLEEKENSLKPTERPKNIYAVEIKQCRAEINKIENNEQTLIDGIMAADHDTLMQYVCNKLSINSNFYKWYRVRKNKEKLNDGEIKSIDLNELNGSRVKAVACMTSISTAKELIDHIVEVNGWINDFVLQSALVNNDIGKRHGISKLYSKEECYRLFKKFYDIDTFLNYLPSYLENDNGLNDVDIFKIFYLENFLDEKKVDPDKFRKTLIKSVLDYYNSLVVKYSSILKGIIAKSLGNIEEAIDCNVNVTKGIIVMNDTVEDLTDDTDYLNGYLSKEEEEELYESLNIYFREMDKMIKGEAMKMEHGKK